MFFSKKQKHDIEIRRRILRFVNEQTLGAVTCIEDNREESRSKLNCGVLLVPLTNGEPDLLAAEFAITRDLSSTGIGIMLNKPISADQGIVVLPGNDRALFVEIELCHRDSLGGGFGLIGAKIVRIVTARDFPALDEIGAALNQSVVDPAHMNGVC